ncbi:MAG: hypothetical protein K1W37_21560 [Lachnospiraceae bacterium]|jgi:hypothetical protein
MSEEKNYNTELEDTENDFQEVELNDCDVPINCPFGLDPAEDLFPNHH